MKEIVLSGSFCEMGRQYGRACRRQIKVFTKMAQLMAGLAERPGADFFTPQYRYVPLVATMYFKNRRRYRAMARSRIDVIRNHYPEALDMLEGMTEGARVEFDDLVFLNAAAESSLRCTTAATVGSETTSGRPILAMNADEAKGVERFEVMLDFRPDSGYRYKVCAMAGVLYYNFGMNEHGLTLMSTFLFVRGEQPTVAKAPMLLYFSILNRCATVAEAQQLLETLPPSDVGTVLYVADSTKFLRSEQCAMGREIEIVEDGFRANANAPTTETLARFSMIDDLDEAASLFSRNRIARLDSLSDTYRGAFDVDAMHALLSDHGDPADGTYMRSMCMHPKHTNGKQTCASMIALPAERTMRIYEPNPCRGEFTEYHL